MDLATIVGVWSVSISVAETERERKEEENKRRACKSFYFLLLFFVRCRVLEDPQLTLGRTIGFWAFCPHSSDSNLWPNFILLFEKINSEKWPENGDRYLDLRQGADNRMTIRHEGQQFLSKNLML